MATERNVSLEFNQMSLNACVLLDRSPVINDYTNTDLLRQPRSIYIPKRRKRVRQSLLLFSDIAQEPSSNSAQIAESHGRLFEEHRVEVTGSSLSINPYFLMPL